MNRKDWTGGHENNTCIAIKSLAKELQDFLNTDEYKSYKVDTDTTSSSMNDFFSDDDLDAFSKLLDSNLNTTEIEANTSLSEDILLVDNGIVPVTKDNTSSNNPPTTKEV